MKPIIFKYYGFIFFILFTCNVFSQIPIEAGDPPNNTNIPDFYKSKLSDIEAELSEMKIGESKVVAFSPGGLPVYALYYGEKEDFHSQANYNSAIAARNVEYYAKKDSGTKPVVFLIGPIHGQEAEGIAGLVNLIHIVETGKDHRGKAWPELKEYFNQCRVIIIPCGNPDGRKRCPYDTFVGLPSGIMTKYGQGTRKDGTFYGWPGGKAVHPMKGDVNILGAYFNNDGINIAHDEFFMPMAEETKAILKIAWDEAPDITVALHSSQNLPHIRQVNIAPAYIKNEIDEFAQQLYKRLEASELPHSKIGNKSVGNLPDDESFPPRRYFDLQSALHYISGTTAFTFECPHGVTTESENFPKVSYNQIVDIQLNLYEEMFKYIFNNRLYSE